MPSPLVPSQTPTETTESSTTAAPPPAAQAAAEAAPPPPPPPAVKKMEVSMSANSTASSMEDNEDDSPAKKEDILAKVRKFLIPVLNSYIFLGTIAFSLILALWFWNFVGLLNLPDDPWNGLGDALMTIVTVIFIFEMIAMTIAYPKTYFNSLFFWMDMLGTFTMVFEINYLVSLLPNNYVNNYVDRREMANGDEAGFNTVFLRIARVAKVFARSGRITKIVKCLPLIFGRRSIREGENQRQEASGMSKRLTRELSTMVCFLTIIMIVIGPLFETYSYPTYLGDMSIDAWFSRLSDDYERAVVDASASDDHTSQIFSKTVEEFRKFYDRSIVRYKPFQFEGFNEEIMVDDQLLNVPGKDLLHGKEPERQMCIWTWRRQKDVEYLKDAGVLFDFTTPTQFDSGADMALILFIVVTMCFITLLLTSALDRLFVKPLERMLSMIAESTKMALGAMESPTSHGWSSDRGENDDGDTDETDLLETILEKMARLHDLAMKTNKISDAELAQLGDDQKGVLALMDTNIVKEDTKRTSVGSSHQVGGRSSVRKMEAEETATVSRLKIDAKLIDSSWELDLIEMGADDCFQTILYIFFDSRSARESPARGEMISVEVFSQFHEKVKKGYNDLPYHNYRHAIDVTYTVTRMIDITMGYKWLTEVDQFAMLIAAFCHDVGHPGVNNPFLVETMHDMALRYNDKSPLENMHCAQLFTICADEKTNVFRGLDATSRKAARKVCIATILHTDMANHFEMLKDVSKVYELNSEVCEKQAKNKHHSLIEQYRTDVMVKDTLIWLQLFLHLADVSNALKPWLICQKWAKRTLDEFFAQGDEEKRLGIPVGMLNDRDKISRPGSQHGFINFLVSPLVIITVRIFPKLHGLTTQMGTNIENWRNMWVEDASPPKEEIEKRDADVQKLKETALELKLRNS
jgi:cAMP-specific phosphodiesterase 4